jgi:hypothetical protein
MLISLCQIARIIGDYRSFWHLFSFILHSEPVVSNNKAKKIMYRHISLRFKLIILLAPVLFFISTTSSSQVTELSQVEQSKEVHFSNPRQRSLRLPFKSINNLIIIPIQINGSDTLNFILDTGINTSIICELSTGENLNLNYAREIQLQGLGTGTSLGAMHAFGNEINVSGIKGINQDYFVLLENIFQLSGKLGYKIHGILSYNVFNSFITQINYKDEEIIFYNPEYFRYKRNTKNYVSLPLIIHDNKPYMCIKLKLADGTIIPLKVLLDTGASNSLWLFKSTLRDFEIPAGAKKSFLGSGLSGDVYGYLSRFDMISIDRFELKDILVSFPDSTSVEYAIGSDRRNGSLGAEVLRRFNVIIDYPNELITLSKNNKYKEPFSYNRCGIEILCPSPGINIYQVAQVNTNSSAERAGIRKYDLIISINDTDAGDLSLNEIYKLFQGKAGKKIKIIVDRSGQRIKFSFELEQYTW